MCESHIMEHIIYIPAEYKHLNSVYKVMKLALLSAFIRSYMKGKKMLYDPDPEYLFIETCVSKFEDVRRNASYAENVKRKSTNT